MAVEPDMQAGLQRMVLVARAQSHRRIAGQRVGNDDAARIANEAAGLRDGNMVGMHQIPPAHAGVPGRDRLAYGVLVEQCRCPQQPNLLRGFNLPNELHQSMRVAEVCGIEPDRHIAGPIEGFNPTTFGRVLYSRQEFANYAQKFTADGDSRIAQTPTGRQLARQNFEVDDAMIADFKELVKADRFKIDEAAFAKDSKNRQIALDTLP